MLKEELENYQPYNKQEEKDKETMLFYCNSFSNVLTRKNIFGHFTSSAIIVNPTRDKVLFIYHNIYNSWAWVGGHADGEADLLAVACREVTEETGIKNLKVLTNQIFAIDILPVFGHVKRGEYVSAHQHLNVTYLLEAEETEELSIKEDENSGVKWIPIKETRNYATEPQMYPVYEKIIGKMKELDI